MKNTLLAYDYEWTCVSFVYNVIKRKHELFKIQRKRKNFSIRLEYAEHKFFCNCIEVYKTCESNDYDKMYGALSKLKKKRILKLKLFLNREIRRYE